MYVNKWMKKQNLWNPNQRDVMQSLRGLFYLHEADSFTLAEHTSSYSFIHVE